MVGDAVVGDVVVIVLRVDVGYVRLYVLCVEDAAVGDAVVGDAGLGLDDAGVS